ncbi:putative HXXXD-type acyl-transferase family protein [Hibiscus syriacus]|uniref:HXXXD-type acyl-transferase family protein n=1 Tax=Hibiscus syriacus TaxID=106335 RepID=A0A6A3ASK3_HIBSY|nr:putative HXXXD-type acyl-transferase family protein [Hibiscus syriacus]
MKIFEVTRVTPPSNSPESATELCLPLTFYDLYWFKFPPVERLFFNQLNELTPACFNSVILPKLKRSLSLTLLHYLPVASNLKWPPDQPKPVVLYTPNDGVPLTVAESSADFNLLSSNGIHDAVELHPFKPELITSDASTSTIALQITLFPNIGFCIGITAHHVVLDGKTATMFIKSWAYICNEGNQDNSTLPLELTPFFDRSVLKGPDGLDMLYLDQWLAMSGSDSNKKSLKITTIPDTGKDLHLSTFVLTYAYVTTCMVKARGGDGDGSVLGFVVDCRSRLNPPVPENYFGNCNRGAFEVAKARDFLGEQGFVYAVEKVSGMVQALMEKGVLEGIENNLVISLDIFKQMAESEVQVITVAGSPRFGVYGTDFGWGKPLKVVIVSIDKSEAFSMAESRDGTGGVEVGVALKKHDMEKFSSLFLKHV